MSSLGDSPVHRWAQYQKLCAVCGTNVSGKVGVGRSQISVAVVFYQIQTSLAVLARTLWYQVAVLF